MVESEIEKIKQTIAAIEAQRHTLGDEVVEAALAPLHEKLAALQAGLLREQRKWVTVLFADIAGFTALSTRLDPEDVRELMSGYFTAWKAAIEVYGGTVEKFIGDAVMAVFGLPVVHEDDPERAIRCALEMRRRLEALNQTIRHEQGIQLTMRVGISTGEVVVGTLGERQKEEFVVVGEAVNLASRLQAAAPEAGILIAHDTYRLVRGIFNVQKVELIQVKGMKGPLQVYLVHGTKPRAFRPAQRGVEGVETRMIGREKEFKRLQNAFLSSLEESECQVIAIVGEPGIGKSRLIYEFDNWLELLPEKVYYFKGRAYPSLQNSPYSLLRSVFSFRFQIYDRDAPTVVWDKLVQGVQAALGSDGAGARKAYFIGRLLGFELGEGLPWEESGGEARLFQEQALAFLRDYFRAVAQQNPVVVLLEDIHWADDSSLDLVYRLDGSLAQQPLLIVCTARPDLFSRRPDWGAGPPFHHRLDLQPLTIQDNRRLVEEILQRVESVPQELQDLVVERAEGNPFFTEEGIKMLIEEGVIEKTGDRWQVHRTGLSGVKIPHTLAGLLQARLDSLDHMQRVLLQRAAVIGRVFWDRAVEFLGKQGDGELRGDRVTVQDMLGELHAREIIYRRKQSTFDDTQEYRFKHTLFRDVTYASLLKRARRVYHARAAHWLERMTQQTARTGEYAALIALHYDQAGERDAAAHWYRRAGSLAAARFANVEAVHAFNRALDLTSEGDWHAQYDIILAREQVLDRQGARAIQANDLEKLAQLAEVIGDKAFQSEAALRQANYAFATGNYSAAIPAAERAIALAQAVDAVEKLTQGYYLWGRSLDFQLAGPEALEKFEKALELARLGRLPQLEADILMSLGPHFSDLNAYGEARKHLTAALQIYRRLGDRHGEGKALGNLGVSFWGQGDPVEARAYFEAALQAIQEVGDRRVEGIILGNLGVLAIENLDYGESRRYHLQALRISREVYDRNSECINLGNLAEAARDLGDFDQAQVYYDQALGLAREIGVIQNQSAILFSSSLLMEYLGDDQVALERAQQALTLAREAKNVLYETGSLFRLAQALLTTGRYAEAGDHFRRALDLQGRLGLENRGIESRAGLARVKLATGDIRGAQAYVEEILLHLQTNNLFNTEEPMRVYLTCFQVLKASADPRAAVVLEAGYHFLQDRLVTIDGAGLRSSFLEKVPSNRKLLELWRDMQEK